MRFRPILLLVALIAGSIASSFAKDYKAGEIQSKQAFLYGKFEFRMHCAVGSGMLTNFFLYKDGSEKTGAENRWEEVDIEVFGKDGCTIWQSNIITEDYNGNNITRREGLHYGTFNAWHTYTLEWTPTSMKWLVDGNEVRNFTDRFILDRLTSPERICFNIWAANVASWVGWFDTNRLPLYGFVQYVRHYAYQSGSGTFSSNPDFNDEFANLDNFYVSTHTFGENYADFATSNIGIINGTLCMALTTAAAPGLATSVPADGDTPPPCDPVVIPARIEAEDFCQKSTPPQPETCDEGGQDMGYIGAGDWLTYKITVPSAGTYRADFRLAAMTNSPQFALEKETVPDSNTYAPLATITGASTGSWQAWQTTTQQIVLPAGTYKIRILALVSGFNINWFEFIAPPNPFASWATAWGLSGANATTTANPSGDGVTNLWKFASNLDPTRASSATLVSGTGTSGLPFISTNPVGGVPQLKAEYLRRRSTPGLVYTVQFSDDLATWTNSSAAGTVTTIDATWERVVVADSSVGAPRRFARVLVNWSN
jgi:hypothetical protein